MRFAGDERVLEFDRAGPVRTRRGPVLLLQSGLQRALTATRTSSSGWAEYPLTGARLGDAELQIDGARVAIAIVEGGSSFDLLGYRAIVETERGLLAELDSEALPFIRLPAGASVPASATFTCSSGTFALSVAKSERRRGSLILHLKPRAELPPGRGELRAGDRAWPVIWVDRSRPRSAARQRYEALAARAHQVQKSGDSQAHARAQLEAAQAAKAAGIPTEVTRMWRAAAYAHFYARRFADAGPLLEKAEVLDRRIGNLPGLLRAAYYRGILLREQGRYRASREILAESITRAEEYGLEREHAFLARALAALLRDLGRHREALQAYRSVEDHFMAASELDRMDYQIDLAWTELRAIEAGLSIPPRQVRERLQETLEHAQRIGAEPQELDALSNLLWLSYLESNDAMTETLLDRLARHPNIDSSFSRLFLHFARAQLRLRQARHDDAGRSFEELRRLARLEADSSDYLWRATYGLGSARLATGDRRSARAWFEEAMEELERLSVETDLRDSRALFFQDRSRLYGDAASLALESGRRLDAMVILDRARSNVLRSLGAKVRMERLAPKELEEVQARRAEYLSLRDRYEKRRAQTKLIDPDTLGAFEAETIEMRGRLKTLFDVAHAGVDQAPPRELTQDSIAQALGDAVLISFAHLNDRTDSFFAAGSAIEHRRSSAGVLDTWSDRLAGADHLYVVPGGEVGVRDVLAEVAASPDTLRSTSISFLPHAGALLGVSTATTSPPVVVADADGTLPLAREEGAWVAERLGAVGIYGREASRERVLGAIQGAALFHFSGHGVLETEQPWDAHLLLAGGEQLTLEDLLIAQPRIGVVVLSGCETGQTSSLSAAERIGLSHAFLVAGTRAVLATVEEVNDEQALRFVRRFYEAGGAVRPIDAWRRAALASITEGDDSWRVFYVLGRRE